MIEVRVRQDDRVDLGRRNRQGLPVPLAQFLQALKKTAVDQYPMLTGIKKVFGAGDCARGAQESESRHRERTLPQAIWLFRVNPACAIVWLAFGVKAPHDLMRIER